MGVLNVIRYNELHDLLYRHTDIPMHADGQMHACIVSFNDHLFIFICSVLITTGPLTIIRFLPMVSMLWVRRTWNDFRTGYAAKARPLALLVQCIRSGSLVVIPHASNDHTIVSFVIASHARTTHCTINGLKEPSCRQLVFSLVPLQPSTDYTDPCTPL